MFQPSVPFILASGSPRRQELLQTLGLQFSVDASDVDEQFNGEDSAEMVRTLSERKALAVCVRHPNAIVLGADTVVVSQGEILGKPKDRQSAARMLRQLSGKWHSVYTGLCLIHTGTKRKFSAVVETKVHFLSIPENDLQAYLATSEPYDKAASYAIQGIAGAFIDQIQGSSSNVIGLPIHAVVQGLREIERD